MDKSTLTPSSKLASSVVFKSVTFLCLEGPRLKISIRRPAVFRYFVVFHSSSNKIPEIRLIYVLPIHYLLPRFRIPLSKIENYEKMQKNSCESSLRRETQMFTYLPVRLCHVHSLYMPNNTTAMRRSTL